MTAFSNPRGYTAVHTAGGCKVYRDPDGGRGYLIVRTSDGEILQRIGCSNGDYTDHTAADARADAMNSNSEIH